MVQFLVERLPDHIVKCVEERFDVTYHGVFSEKQNVASYWHLFCFPIDRVNIFSHNHYYRILHYKIIKFLENYFLYDYKSIVQIGVCSLSFLDTIQFKEGFEEI